MKDLLCPPAVFEIFNRTQTKGFFVIFGSCLIFLILGFNYVWGGINMYAASYYKFVHDPDLNLDYTSIVFAFSKFFTPVGVALSTKILKFFNLRVYIFFSGSLIFFSIFIASYMTSFWMFALFFSFVFGFFVGLLYMVVLMNAYRFFPEHKSIVSGVLMAFYGFGGLFFSPIALEAINPENVPPVRYTDGNNYFPAEIYEYFPDTVRILAYTIAILIALSVPTIFDFAVEEKSQNKEGGIIFF